VNVNNLALESLLEEMERIKQEWKDGKLEGKKFAQWYSLLLDQKQRLEKGIKPVYKHNYAAIDAANSILQEYFRAATIHPPMHSAAEGYAILLEELDELWDEIKKRNPDKEELRKEAIHVGAMALRFLVDVVGVK